MATESSPLHEADQLSAHQDDVANLSYEEARDELVKVVGALEQGTSSLQESLALWERGEALAARCEQWLIGAKARLDAVRGAQATQAAHAQPTDSQPASPPAAEDSSATDTPQA